MLPMCADHIRLGRVGRFCKEHHLAFIIDSAQSAGLDVDIRRLNADAIAFTGHKGFFGPQGSGALSLRMN